jgi:Zn-dependent peptidase ImmA (M78 family)
MMTRALLQLDLAEYLAETYFPDSPVEPLELAEKHAITSSFGHYESAFDGLLELRDTRFHIYLNADRLIDIDSPRARFTAAHELGHFFIDDHRHALAAGVKPHPSFTEFVTDELAEFQADSFAAALLLPPKRFQAEARGKRAAIATIVKLAKLFKTSMMSTAITYARSDVAPVTVMLWDEKRRRWCWSAQSVWELTHNKAYRDSARVPSGSVTQSLLCSSESPLDCIRGSTLSQWFPSISPGSRNDRICREEAMRLGKFGVLTLLEIE